MVLMIAFWVCDQAWVRVVKNPNRSDALVRSPGLLRKSLGLFLLLCGICFWGGGVVLGLCPLVCFARLTEGHDFCKLFDLVENQKE